MSHWDQDQLLVGNVKMTGQGIHTLVAFVSYWAMEAWEIYGVEIISFHSIYTSVVGSCTTICKSGW